MSVGYISGRIRLRSVPLRLESIRLRLILSVRLWFICWSFKSELLKVLVPCSLKRKHNNKSRYILYVSYGIGARLSELKQAFCNGRLFDRNSLNKQPEWYKTSLSVFPHPTQDATLVATTKTVSPLSTAVTKATPAPSDIDQSNTSPQSPSQRNSGKHITDITVPTTTATPIG